MYEKIEVWVRSSEEDAVHVFVCFRSLINNLFYVQSIDSYRPEDDAKSIVQLRKNSVELFLETKIEERTTGFPTLVAAIEAGKEWAEIRP